MPRFAANLAYLFTERPLIERFGAAAAAGFSAVELQLPYDHSPAAVRAELDRHGLLMLGINTALGQPAAGGSGVAAVPGHESEFAMLFKQAVPILGRRPGLLVKVIFIHFTFFPVFFCAGRGVSHFWLIAWSAIERSMSLMLTGSSLMLSTQAPSHRTSTGHTREQLSPRMFESRIVSADPRTLSLAIFLMKRGTSM